MSNTIKTQPPLNKRTNKEFLVITLGGSLLALSSGMLNATTVASDRRMTSQPMTGTSTMIGISIAEGDSAVFGDKIGILLFHILGAAVSGYLVPHTTFYMGSDYGRLLKISLSVLTAAYLISNLTPDSIFWYYLVAFAGGVQNAMTSKYSGNILRTTHISGSVTDMGLIIGRRNFTLTAPMWKFYVNLSIVSSYFLGALIGGYTLKELGDSQLLINMCLYAIIIALYFVLVKKEKEYRCCLSALGLSDPSLEEDYNGSAEVSTVEEGVDNIPQDVAAAASSEQEQVDSDEEEDSAEPLDNQLVEEDLEGEGGEGQIIVAPADTPLTDEGSAELGGIQLGAVEELEQEVSQCAAGACPVDAAPSPTAPRKEMDHAWSFRVMMAVVCLLCFNAAFINATTKLSSKELFTSHITGATTKLALAITDEDGVGVKVRLFMIFLYALGAVITGSVVKSDFYSLRAPYKRLFAFGSMLLTLGLLLHIYFPDAYFFYYCMSLFCGMQSALGCKVKNSVLRTCYMSGTATDIGTTIGKVLKKGATKTTMRPIQLLTPCLVSYVFGAFVAKLLFPLLGKYNTCVNIGIFVFLSIVYWGFQHPRKVMHWLSITGVSSKKA